MLQLIKKEQKQFKNKIIMKNYFLVGIKYEKTAEEGKIVKVNEAYLVDALSFTEAEARINEEMQPFISGKFIVDTIKRAKINELFPNESGDKWFKSKVFFVSLDEEKGVEKKTHVFMLVHADTVHAANKTLIFHMRNTMADYTIEGVKETKIMDVFKYEAK